MGQSQLCFQSSQSSKKIDCFPPPPRPMAACMEPSDTISPQEKDLQVNVNSISAGPVCDACGVLVNRLLTFEFWGSYKGQWCKSILLLGSFGPL